MIDAVGVDDDEDRLRSQQGARLLGHVRNIVDQRETQRISGAKAQMKGDFVALPRTRNRRAEQSVQDGRHRRAYFIVGMTKLAFSRTPPFGQRAVTVLTRV